MSIWIDGLMDEWIGVGLFICLDKGDGVQLRVAVSAEGC